MLAIARNLKLLPILRAGAFQFQASACSTNAVVDYEAEKAKLLAKLNEELPKPYDGPERDLVNFPRRQRAFYPAIVRHGFVPQEWLDFFYKKTGVSGPYVFGLGMLNFLLSKELYVIEEELSTGVALFILIYIGFKKFGPALRKLGDKFQEEEQLENTNMKLGSIANLEKAIEFEKKKIWHMGTAVNISAAKRENVHMQLETEYRSRMMTAYNQVKKRLDYFLDMDTTRRKLEQKHMVEWIVQNVLKNITPQQEKEALQKCITDLKMLSARSS